MNLQIASILSVLIFSLIPNSFASTLNSTLDEQGNYLNPSLGVGFQAPQGWIVQEPKKSQSGAPDIAIVGPYSGEFTPSISFIIEKANGTSLSDYFENKKDQMTKNVLSQDISFLSEQDSTINGYNAKIIILRENFTENGQSTTIKFKQAFVLANDNFYRITYANVEKNFDSDLSSYDTLLNSITFANSENPPMVGFLPIIGGIAVAISIGIILVIKRKKSQFQSKSNIKKDKE